MAMGSWSLGNNADVTPLENVLGEFISDSVRDSAVESEAFRTSDIVARILNYRGWRAGVV